MKCISIPVIVLMLCAVLAHDASAQRRIGVALEHDSTSSITATAGETIPFMMHALDDQGQTVTDWQSIGVPLTLTVAGSRAETDSSSRSWNADADGYSWLRIAVNDSILALDSINTDQGDIRLFYTIMPGTFTAGRASLTFAQSRADTVITLSLAPRWNALRQDSPPIRILPAAHAGYLVDLTSAVPDFDAVYLLRLYEVLVTPRDRFMNPIADHVIPTEFTARFPGEFANIPGTSGPLGGTVDIEGETALYLASNVSRGDTDATEEQWIGVHRASSPGESGRSDPYAVLDHAPYPFSLSTPLDKSEITYGIGTQQETFTWEAPDPRDPCSNVRISRIDTSHIHSDSVRYTVRFFNEHEMGDFMEYPSDDSGRTPQLTLSHTEIWDMMVELSGSITIKQMDFIWYVEANDGLYITRSDPPTMDNPSNLPGFRLNVEIIVDVVANLPPAMHFGLGTNYPNPFNPSTTIPVSTEHADDVRLCVLNLLGEEVALLHDGTLTPGEHRFQFNATGLPSGVYRYQLEMDGRTMSRSMLLLR